MFRRSKTDPEPTSQPEPKPGGKGRPTPTRREAEAAAKARSRAPRSRKEAAAAQRLQRFESNQKMREAMKSGDDRYLPLRDKGPVRRFIRDYLDSRLLMTEFLLPLMLVTLLGGLVLGPQGIVWLNATFYAGLLVAILEMVLLRFRLRRELKRRFPDESLQGTTFYTVMRAMAMRWMRAPKPQVRIGEQLPEHYR